MGNLYWQIVKVDKHAKKSCCFFLENELFYRKKMLKVQIKNCWTKFSIFGNERASNDSFQYPGMKGLAMTVFNIWE